MQYQYILHSSQNNLLHIWAIKSLSLFSGIDWDLMWTDSIYVGPICDGCGGGGPVPWHCSIHWVVAAPGMLC